MIPECRQHHHAGRGPEEIRGKEEGSRTVSFLLPEH